jgi:pimeloyl-ACP methyl ester carboxylesterase
LVVQQFAANHPADVAGIVLLDASHPEQFARHPEYLDEIDSLMPLLRWTPLLARVGLMRLYARSGDAFDFGELPARQRAELAAAWSSAKHWDSQPASLSTLRSFYAEAHSLGSLGDVPLVVITAGDNHAVGWQALQVELAALSSNSVHKTVEGATHASLAFNPTHAKRVSDLVLEIRPRLT